MSLDNLRSIFEDELKVKTQNYISNNVTNVNDTKLTQFTTPELSQ